MYPLTAWTVLVATLAVASAIKPPKSTTDQSTNRSLNQRINELEDVQQNLKTKVTLITAHKVGIEDRLYAIEQQLGTANELATVKDLLKQSDAQNQEMKKMLSNYERFFGTLYAESPEAFDPTEAVDVRMSKLNTYLGNREAELLSLRPAPTTVVETETVNQELLGGVLYDLEDQRSMYDRKLRKLEEKLARIAGNVPEHANGQPQGGQGGQGGRPTARPNNQAGRKKRYLEENTSVSDELDERIERLENLMVLQLLPLLNETLGQASLRMAQSSSTALYNLTQIEQLSEQIEDFRSSRPDSKKVAFSVARTTHMIGKSYEQIIEFDHVFLNKGGHFNEDNSTFLCSVPGYYFVSFTMRSFDGYVLGVNLMKNDDHVTSVFTDAHDRNVMESQSVIVHMVRGDIMWLRHPPSTRFALHSDRYRYTTFSAFLIYKGD